MAVSRFLTSVGRSLLTMMFDDSTGSLDRSHEQDLPEPIQVVARHPLLPVIYAACSNGGLGSTGAVGDRHSLVALRPDEDDRLVSFGPVVAQAHRAIHMTVDPDGTHLIVAHNRPSTVTVLALADDGSLGMDIAQPDGLDFGVFSHEACFSPDGRHVIVVARGNDATPTTPEEPGALLVFSYDDGRLAPVQVVAPNRGIGFGPRNVEFHPTRPWTYACLERSNELVMFTQRSPMFAPEPDFRVTTLHGPAIPGIRQIASTVIVHPNGRFLYCSNRASRQVSENLSESNGGENAVVSYYLDSRTGEPRVIGHHPTAGMHPRTVSMDPSAGWIVAANKSPTLVDGEVVPTSLDVFRICDDGALVLHCSVPVDEQDASVLWAGFL